MKFVLTTDDLNTYGYRVLTSGIDISTFVKNPVMFYAHETWREPIGHWEDIRKEDGQLVATAVFDSDEKAQLIKSKVDSGTLRACSIGFRKIVTSDDPKDLVLGQRYGTVMNCELYECSIVAIPGNINALVLKGENGLTLSGGGDENVLSQFLPIIKPKSKSVMKNLMAELGLAEDANESVAVEAVRKLKADKAATLMAAAEAKGMLNDENREQYQLIANAQPDVFSKLIAAHKPAVVEAPKGGELSAAIEEANRRAEQNRQLGGGANQDKNAWEAMLDVTGSDVAKMEAFKKEHPDKYALAFKAKYGFTLTV